MPTTCDNSISPPGLEVPLGSVDRELKKLWDQDQAKTRASLVNFAIYSEDPAALARNNGLLEHITADHACRALLILCLPDIRPPRARAWINALCRPYQGTQVVCSEQISFLLEGGDAAQVQNVVFAHLDSDLPLFVWWQGALTKNFEERFYSRIDTLVIDSSAWADPSAQFAHLNAAMQMETAHFDVRDLSWTRTHFMRTALASCAQDTRALRLLPHLQSIRVTHDPRQRCAALFLAGWIAVRLGCVLDVGARGIVFTRPDGGALAVTLEESATGCAVQSLLLEGPNFRTQITRQADSAFIHVCAACEGHAHEVMLPADPQSDADLISEQLSRAGGTTLLSTLLPLMVLMLEKQTGPGFPNTL